MCLWNFFWTYKKESATDADPTTANAKIKDIAEQNTSNAYHAPMKDSLNTLDVGVSAI